MSHKLTFNVLPFDPRHAQKAEIPLPITPQDLADTLQTNWPDGDVQIYSKRDETVVRFYITFKEDLWLMARYTESFGGCFFVSGLPKTLATEIILWYREYIADKLALFVVVVESGSIYDLTSSTTTKDIDRMYPFPIDEGWEWEW